MMMEYNVNAFCFIVFIFIQDKITCDGSCPVNCQAGQICPDSDCPYGKCSPGYWGRKCEHPLDCLIPGDYGVHYRGTENVTRGGTPCLNWDYSADFGKPPDGPHHNYCRHVTTDSQPNTWCYNATDGLKRWDVCGIPYCDTMCPPPNIQAGSFLNNIPSNGFTVGTTIMVECQIGFVICKPFECLMPDDNGVHYRGTENVTRGGTPCLNWDYSANFGKPPDGPHHNYCRHVTTDSQPNTWCYNATDGLNRWDVCDIPYCDNMHLHDTKNCPKGYYSVSKNMRTRSIHCTEQLIWSAEFPTCVDIYCNILTSHFEFDGTNESNVHKVGSRVVIKCLPGYRLTGSNILECTANGSWSLQVPCIAICTKPELKPNSHTINEHDLYNYNELLEIRCNQGYKTDDKRHFVCQDDTRWNGTMPYCYAICSKPSLKEHSKIFNEATRYKYKNNMTIVCDPGYETTDLTQLTCQDNRTWSRSPPVCFAISCAIPQLKNHSTALIKTSEIKYLDKITIVCDEGYAIEGTGLLQCQANKLWNHDTPTCEETSNEAPLNLKAIIGGVVAVLVVIAIIIIVIVLRRRRRCQQRDESSCANYRKSDNKMDRLPQTNDYEMSLNVNSDEYIYANAVTEEDGKYYDVIPVPNPIHPAVKIQDIDNYVNKRLANTESLEKEFQRLTLDFQKPMRNAEKAENRKKNRNKSISPYDENRVKPRPIPNQPGSDYINASMIDIYGCVKRFIAAQAPFETTINDFWRMIWEFKVKQIVAITSDEEERENLYLKYWKYGSIGMFGKVRVSLKKEDIFHDYTIREISVTIESGESRTIKQYHFTSWPEKGVPENTSTLISVRNLVCNDTRTFEHPIVVHCSTGIGRTGTFIAFDYLMDQAKVLKYVDVFECAKNLEKQRINMIQTKEQYVYLYKLLQEALALLQSASVSGDDALRYQELLPRETSAPIYSTLQETATCRTYVNDDLV